MYIVSGVTTAFLLCGSENQFSETLNYGHELVLSTVPNKLGLVARGYNFSTQETEAGGSETDSIGEASLVYTRSYFNRIK